MLKQNLASLPNVLGSGWREHGAGSPQAKKKRAEARAQRHHGNLRIKQCPRHRGQFSFANESSLRKAFGVSLRFAVSEAAPVLRIAHQIDYLS